MLQFGQAIYCRSCAMDQPLIGEEPFSLLQVKSICRSKEVTKTAKYTYLLESRKHCQKMRYCWLPVFSLFPMLFKKMSMLELSKQYSLLKND